MGDPPWSTKGQPRQYSISMHQLFQRIHSFRAVKTRTHAQTAPHLDRRHTVVDRGDARRAPRAAAIHNRPVGKRVLVVAAHC